MVFASLDPLLTPAMTAMSATMNVVAGASKALPAATDPNTFKGRLEDASGKIFGVFASTLESTVKGIFNGDFTTDSNGKVDGKDPAQFITDIFSNGTLVDKNIMDPAVDKWNSKAASYMVCQMISSPF